MTGKKTLSPPVRINTRMFFRCTTYDDTVQKRTVANIIARTVSTVRPKSVCTSGVVIEIIRSYCPTTIELLNY